MANLISPLHHYRCYRSKATDHFLLLTKRGVEFLDIQGDDHMRNDWLRAGCSFGFLPCNGLLYMTPHHCFCYPGVRMNGFLALASKQSDSGAKADDSPRLERGPAYPSVGNAQIAGNDGQSATIGPRTGTTRREAATSHPTRRAHLAPAWQTTLHGRLSQPVVAGGTALRCPGRCAYGPRPGCREWPTSLELHGRGPRRFVAQRPRRPGSLRLPRRLGLLPAALPTGSWPGDSARAQNRQIVAFDQLESLWPVPGSVLVQNGVAYVTAGRSSFLDGGVYLYGLDPATGRVLCETRVESSQPKVDKEVGRPFDMEGTKSDILVGDGKNVYLYQMVFDGQLRRQEAPRKTTLGDRPVGLHLMSTGGLVDYEWYDRTYWTYSRRWPGFYFTDRRPRRARSWCSTARRFTVCRRLRIGSASAPRTRPAATAANCSPTTWPTNPCSHPIRLTMRKGRAILGPHRRNGRMPSGSAPRHGALGQDSTAGRPARRHARR